MEGERWLGLGSRTHRRNIEVAWRSAVREPVYVLAVLIVLVPTLALLFRWDDPSRGQIRAGWQMHTDCWGRVNPCR